MMGPPMGGGGYGGGPSGPRPTRRNPIMVTLLPFAVMVGGNILGAILAGVIHPALAIVGSVLSLVGLVLLIISLWKMLGELKAVTNDPDFNPWFIIVPCLQIYFIAVKLPEQVNKAKQMTGCQVPGRGVLYIVSLFFSPLLPWALASDLNDMAG